VFLNPTITLFGRGWGWKEKEKSRKEKKIKRSEKGDCGVGKRKKRVERKEK